MVSVPRSVPRVAVIQVAPRPPAGKGTEVDDTGRTGFAGSPAVLAASSSIFSTCTRMSAPRLVRIGGGPGLMSGGLGWPLAATGAASGAARLGAGGRITRDILDLDALMGREHDVVPGLRRQRAAGHAVGRRVVVIAVPHRAGEV